MSVHVWDAARRPCDPAGRHVRADQIAALLAPGSVRDVARFNPRQPRDPEGKWTDVPGAGIVRAAADKLSLASRIDLQPGEQLLSSRKFRGSDADSFDLLIAEVHTGPGREIRLGIINPDDGKHWSAGPDPKRAAQVAELRGEIARLEALPELTDRQSDRLEEMQSQLLELEDFDADYNRTVVVSPRDVGVLRTQLQVGVDQAKAWATQWDRFWAEHDAESEEHAELYGLSRSRQLSAEQRVRLDELSRQLDVIGDPDPDFISGSVPGGPEGDLHYLVQGAGEEEPASFGIQLGIKPRDADPGWYIGSLADDAVNVDAADARRLLTDLAGLAGETAEPQAAQEADGSALRRYWTKNPKGLARWASKPHPWTALYRQLVKHMPPAKAKRVASAWFKTVFGIWPGERAGDNPAGPG